MQVSQQDISQQTHQSFIECDGGYFAVIGGPKKLSLVVYALAYNEI